MDKGAGGFPPASIQAFDSQIIDNVATTQGGGINAATCDGIVLTNTELSGNFGERSDIFGLFKLHAVAVMSLHLVRVAFMPSTVSLKADEAKCHSD